MSKNRKKPMPESSVGSDEFDSENDDTSGPQRSFSYDGSTDKDYLKSRAGGKNRSKNTPNEEDSESIYSAS